MENLLQHSDDRRSVVINSMDGQAVFVPTCRDGGKTPRFFLRVLYLSSAVASAIAKATADKKAMADTVKLRLTSFAIRY